MDPLAGTGEGGSRPNAMSHSFDDSHMVSQRILKMLDVLECRESAASNNIVLFFFNVTFRCTFLCTRPPRHRGRPCGPPRAPGAYRDAPGHILCVLLSSGNPWQHADHCGSRRLTASGCRAHWRGATRRTDPESQPSPGAETRGPAAGSL